MRTPDTLLCADSMYIISLDLMASGWGFEGWVKNSETSYNLWPWIATKINPKKLFLIRMKSDPSYDQVLQLKIEKKVFIKGW